MAFYITSNEPIVRYSSSSNPACCQIYTSSLELQLHEGSGVGSYPFGPTVKPRIFNGAIHYETMETTTKVTSPEPPSVNYPADTVVLATSNFFSGNSGGYGIMFDIVSGFLCITLFYLCSG
jgi:hypothetical protein